MSFFSKHRNLYWIIAFLLVTNLATIGTILYHNYKFKRNFRAEEHMRRKENRMNSRLGKMFKRELGLTKEQNDEFRSHRRAFHKDAKSIMREMHHKRREFMETISKEKVDEAAALHIAEEFGELHEEMKIKTMHLYLKMRETCTPEQRDKLKWLFESMIDRSDFEERHFKRRRQGKRWGQRNRKQPNDSINTSGPYKLK